MRVAELCDDALKLYGKIISKISKKVLTTHCQYGIVGVQRKGVRAEAAPRIGRGEKNGLKPEREAIPLHNEETISHCAVCLAPTF